MTYPKYRYLIIDGVCRQDFPGGRWHQLTLEPTDQLLSRFDGQQLEQPVPTLRALPDEAYTLLA